jgi:hypothetical protein
LEENSDDYEEHTTQEPGLGFDNGDVSFEEMDDAVPYICGSFNGWRYQKMRKVYDLCSELDSENFMPVWDECQDRGLIKMSAKLKTCTPHERNIYERTRK